MLNEAERFKELYEALLDAFPSIESFTRLVQFQFGINLNQISASRNLSEAVFAFLNYMNAHGRLGEVLRGARTFNPGNPRLRAIAESLAVTPQDARAFEGFIPGPFSDNTDVLAEWLPRIADYIDRRHADRVVISVPGWKGGEISKVVEYIGAQIHELRARYDPVNAGAIDPTLQTYLNTFSRILRNAQAIYVRVLLVDLSQHEKDVLELLCNVLAELYTYLGGGVFQATNEPPKFYLSIRQFAPNDDMPLRGTLVVTTNQVPDTEDKTQAQHSSHQEGRLCFDVNPPLFLSIGPRSYHSVPLNEQYAFYWHPMSPQGNMWADCLGKWFEYYWRRSEVSLLWRVVAARTAHNELRGDEQQPADNKQRTTKTKPRATSHEQRGGERRATSHGNMASDNGGRQRTTKRRVRK